MQEIALHDFTGGLVEREAPTDFTDRQWSKLYGVVLESESEVRTQWGWQKVGAGTGFVDFGVVDDIIVGKKSDGSLWYATVPADGSVYTATRAQAWTSLGYTRANAHPAGVIPLRNTSAQGFVAGLLINGVDETGSALVVYRDPGTLAVTVQELTNRHPTATTSDAMPRGDVAVMWGDFLVLGDTHWVKNDGAAYGSTNTQRYPHGLWFSQAGQPYRWDTIDVEFMGVKEASHTEVHAMLPLETGLLVVTSRGVYLLRGTATDHDYEELRVGAACNTRHAATWWAHTGAAAWVDRNGQVWHTNGSEFARLDGGLDLPRAAGPNDQVASLGEFLTVLRNGRLFAFRVFQNTGAWSELRAPGTLVKINPIGDHLYALDSAGQMWRLNRVLTAERGLIDGATFELAVASRTLEVGEGHKRASWRRFGVRVDGRSATARLVRATVRPGPALDADQPVMDITLGRPLATRDAQVVPGHGSSAEASVEWVFVGDVSIEQVSAWVGNGRIER